MSHALTHPTDFRILGSQGFSRVLVAGVARVVSNRADLNRINIFPVADSDTGTNLGFTLDYIRRSVRHRAGHRLDVYLAHVAEAALDGARGNSGAIMAQFFHGLSRTAQGCDHLDAPTLSRAAGAGAEAAWTAMADPVPGTLPTVLSAFADALADGVARGVTDLRLLLRRGLEQARRSLARTPDLLPVLRDAGVVDAGAQGFVHFLEGIWAYVESGELPADVPVMEAPTESPAAVGAEPEHRFCTECLLDGECLDPAALRARLAAEPVSALIVAGGGTRLRVHVHTDDPGRVFLICGEHGSVRQQKADDMRRQHSLLNQAGRVAVVTDSAADLPAEQVERLGIHVVPLRLSLGEREYLDKLSISPREFYRRVAASGRAPTTSQPPPADYRRQYELLTSHGLDVLAVSISGALSGSLDAARGAAARHNPARITVFDTLNAACGQGLLVSWAAEAAAAGRSVPEIVAGLERLRPLARTVALVRDLEWGVRGGRVRPWMRFLAKWLRLNPVLANSRDGRLTARGLIPGHRDTEARFARWILRRLEPERTYRLMIAHTDAAGAADALRVRLLAGHPRVHSCHVEEASPAVGAHAGPGSLLVGWMPDDEVGVDG